MKNIDINDITTVIGSFINKGIIIITIIIVIINVMNIIVIITILGFKRATLKTSSLSSELTMKRGKGRFRITRHSNTKTNVISNDNVTGSSVDIYDHDRKKNVLISPDEEFLKYLKITTAEGRPKVSSLSSSLLSLSLSLLLLSLSLSLLRLV